MLPVEIIARKRDGHELSAEQIGTFIRGYARDEIPDYQMSALAMAIFLRGMSSDEIACLTGEMLRSGETLQWDAGVPPRVDKHSTGGVGDKSSLVLAPLLACAGVLVPMISGRGLGPSGGTLDKLEAIPGFCANLSTDELRRQVESIGCAIIGAGARLAPADRKLYALRDVTATVPSIPLIAASIMSKKLAEGLNALVLDVKFGSGAFMKSFDRAAELALTMVEIGRRMDLPVRALVTDMNQPNGRLCGNAVEVNEALETLAGRGPEDLLELVLALGAEAVVAAGAAEDQSTARRQLRDHLDSGRAREKFEQMIAAQGGDLSAPRPVAPPRPVLAETEGHVQSIDAEALGYAIVALGGGRTKLEDKIDPSVGLRMHVRLGDRVARGQPLVSILAQPDAAARVMPRVSAAVRVGEEPPKPGPLVRERIG